MRISNGDVVDIRREGYVTTVVITCISLKYKDVDMMTGTISFKLAQPDETTVTTVGAFLFFDWMEKAKVLA